jgi:hypothetical protein
MGRRETQRIWMQKKQAARKSAGLCSSCGLYPPREGRVSCIECAHKRRERRGSSRPDWKSLSAMKRFWSQVRKGDGCWEWTGARSKGYGQVRLNGRRVGAHVASFELNVGPVGGLDVLHRCDNPPCVRPDHLFLGTAKDNVADMMAKGRNRPLRGEANGCSKLTEPEVVAVVARIRAGQSDVVVAKETGVSRSVVHGIRTGRSWRHVTGGALACGG